jgi:histidine triad (HIT) family protein
VAEGSACVFCKILSGEAEASFVYGDERVAAFMAVPQAGRGHVLVVPARHYENAYDLPDELAEPIFSLALRLARAVKRSLQPDGVTLAQNNERGANQTVMHFHLHVIGRIAGQRLNIHDPAGLSDRDELDGMAEKIKAALGQDG